MFGDFGAIMKLLGNREKLAAEAEKLKASVAAITAEGTAGGGGMVRVTVGGDMAVRRVQLAESALAMQDRSALEDLILSATNQALSGAKAQVAAETQKLATSLGLPAGLLANIPGLS